MRVALFQPGIPQNVGAAIRLAACFGVGLDIIEPCSFPLDDKSLKRAALDYGPLAHMKRHDGWESFLAAPERAQGRLLLFTTRGAVAFHQFEFQTGDTLLFGNESRGAPEEVHAAAQGRLVIPLRPEARSMNLATTVSMALGEALRQTDGFFDLAAAAAAGAPPPP
ncbi:MAG: tRNA (cytidine(34)-2'-O)-methyltransferase [Alphaproteobacteria bacterium]|nr:tRNA (cytidine(34)-2'-O)-methyltransferase [Alphaproteobacteria bacterium]